MLVLAVASYALDRADTSREGRSPASLALLALAPCSARSSSRARWRTAGTARCSGWWPGPVCAVLAWAAVSGVLDRARRRLDAGARRSPGVYADAAALLLAALAVFVPPLRSWRSSASWCCSSGGRRREGEKYAGLRILR